jgi:hypothetical protein
MPLFAPLSAAEKKSLRAAPALTLPQRLASMLQLHHTRVIDLFRALDKNEDGEVTKPELAEALRSLGVDASQEEVDELFHKLDPDGSGGIDFRELQRAMKAAAREEPTPKVWPQSRSVSKSASRHSSRQGSRSGSQPPSPRWHQYENSFIEAATGMSPTGGASWATGAVEPGGASAEGGSGAAVGVLTEGEYHLLDEIVRVAVAESAREDGAGEGVTLLKVLSAYEMVLGRHGVAAIEDTRYYQLLLQLSLLPQHDWRDKLGAFRSHHLATAANGARRSMHASPRDGGEGYGAPSLAEADISATAALRAAADTLRSTRDADVTAANLQPSSRGGGPSPGRASTSLPSLFNPSLWEHDTGPGYHPLSSPPVSRTPGVHHIPTGRASYYSSQPLSPGSAFNAARSPPPPSPAAPAPAGSFGSLYNSADATGQSNWYEAFLGSHVGGLSTGPQAGLGTDLKSPGATVPPPLGQSHSGRDDDDPRAPAGHAYAGNGKYMPLLPASEVRVQATQMRAALAFESHKLSPTDAAAYESFRQTANAFRSWRKTAYNLQHEANHFRAAVSRWLMAVGYWENRLLAKCLFHWLKMPRQLTEAATQCAARSRAKIIRCHFEAMVDVFRGRRVENSKLRRAALFFGGGLLKAAFQAWRTVLLQAKSWFLQGETAHLEYAWGRMRKGCGGAAKVGHRLMTAAGLDMNKRRRAAFNRLVMHAHSLIGLQAAVGFWRTMKIRAALCSLSEFALNATRTRRLLRRSLSHHGSVLMQAVFKEWFIAIRHEVIARSAYRRASLILSLHKWASITRQSAALKIVAFGFMASSDTAMMRAVLQGWHRDCTRLIAKQRKIGSAVMHAWMSLLTWTMAVWKRQLAEAKSERQAIAHGARMWIGSSLGKAWNTWQSWSAQRSRYLHLAAQIASSSATGLRALIWAAWTQMHHSSLRLRENVLDEHRVTRTRRWLRKFQLGIATSRRQKAVLRHLASSSATRVLQMHLQAWHELKVTRKALDVKSRLHLGRLLNAQLAAGLLTWLAHVDEIVRARATMSLCVHRFTHREQSRALQQWISLAESQRAALAKLNAATYRLQNQNVVRAFGSWHAAADELAHKRRLVRNALGRMRMRLIAMVYDAWANVVARTREVEAILYKASLRIANRLTFMVWEAWFEYLDSRRRCRAIAARITGNHELGMLANGLAQWARRADEKRENHAKLRQSLGYFANRLAAMSWVAWVSVVDQAKATRAKLLPIANRLLHRLINLTFLGWVAFVAQIRDERTKASRALGLWSGKLSLRCLLGWIRYTHKRQSHRRENADAIYMRDARLAGSHLRAWHGAWVHRATERNLMTRSMQFLQNNTAMRCMSTWRGQAAAATARKTAMQATLRRWRNQRLNSGFRTMVEQLMAERDAKEKAYRGLCKLMNRHLNLGWMTWQEFSNVRLATMAKMRVVGETVMSRGKRQAFNSMLVLFAEAQYLQQSRMLIQLREVRKAVNNWSVHGRNRRAVISALRRLTQRGLTRGWMSWYLVWRECVAIAEAAHAKAHQFIGRLLHLEIARGWSSLLEQWRRVQELRIILRRVANPRACGMLRRWLKIAGVHKEKLRKLRSAVSFLTHGVQTRIVKAWRHLCFKRRMVKQRVAALIGRMIVTTFRGWARFARRRADCRAAAEELHSRQRERVCSDWIRRWMFTARLSNRLAAGLRSLFLRSTFSVFAAWAAWAEDEREDRIHDTLLKTTIKAGPADALDLLDDACRRWYMLEESSAISALAAHANFAANAEVFTRLAITHSTQALMVWAFREYAFAVKVQLEERAAALFYEHGRLSFVMRLWSHLAKKSSIANSRAARAIFHFFGRLLNLIFFRWRETCHTMKNNRLATLAAKLHFQGTLSWRIFLIWKEHVQYIRWCFKQTQMGLARHFLTIERAVYMAWKETTMLMRELRKRADSIYLDKESQELLHAVQTWVEFASHSRMLFSTNFASAEYNETSVKRKFLIRWRSMSRIMGAIENMSETIFGNRRRGGLRRGWTVWIEQWDVRDRARELMDGALEYGDKAQKRTLFRVWTLSTKLSSAALQSLRLAFASYSGKAVELGFARWTKLVSQRAEHLRQIRRTLAHYGNALLVRIVKSWATVRGKRARRDDICQKFIRQLLHRHVALAWRRLVQNVQHSRDLKIEIINMAFRSEKGKVVLRFRDWVKVFRDWQRFSSLEGTALGHRLGVISGSIRHYMRQWAKTARVAVTFGMLAGRHGMRRQRVAFSAFIVYRHYRRFALAAQRVEAEVLASALNVWLTYCRLGKALEVMGAITVTRESRRRLRAWRTRAERLSSCELRRRYLTSRRLFYQRQEIIRGWHIQATAGQHARRLSQLSAFRQLTQLSRERHFRRRSCVRALAMWSTSLSLRVCKAWQLHTRMAREARYELLRARANQTTLDAHRRRARARALSTIVTSWRRYTRMKAETRTLADATANGRRRRDGFGQWRLRAAIDKRSFVAEGLAFAHQDATGRRQAFGKWAVQSNNAVRRAGTLLMLLQRRALATRLTILLAWRGLVERSRSLFSISQRVGGRLLRTSLIGWRTVVRTIILIEEQIDGMHERARGIQLAAALDTLHRYARRTICESVIAVRHNSREMRETLHLLRAVLLRARNRALLAVAHALCGKKAYCMRMWRAHVDGRRSRRFTIASAVEERMYARMQGSTGEVMRTWRAC